MDEIFCNIGLQICENPNDLLEGAIMQKYVELLEQTIKNHPYYWLWSHIVAGSINLISFFT